MRTPQREAQRGRTVTHFAYIREIPIYFSRRQLSSLPLSRNNAPARAPSWRQAGRKTLEYKHASSLVMYSPSRVLAFALLACAIGAPHAAAGREPTMHTVFSAECTPYFDWQSLGLARPPAPRHPLAPSPQPACAVLMPSIARPLSEPGA